ncbi:MAG: serine/threonine-protein kinase, partial [Pseudonocardia sp.]
MGTPTGTGEWWDERATTRSWSVPGYTEVCELGRGGCGTVVRARADHLGRDVAIKYLDPELLADGSFRQAFRAEARLLAGLDSPHIARLHEYVERAGAAAIVMELVEGASLRSTLARGGPVEPEAALSVLKGSLLGLGTAHAAGVVHRDYKPANVLVTRVGESVLVDFGIAARSGGIADGSGTPAYMAPEQWAGGLASPRGDTYSATVTFFECLTGRLPFPGTDLATLRAQHEHADVPVDVLPAAVRDLARHGMAKDPAWRPADAEEFLDELEYAATAGYGEDWEERGRDALARRVALLLLVPSPPEAAGGTGLGRTEVRGGGRGSRRGSARAVLGTVVAVLICSGAVAVIAARKPPPEPELVPSVAVTTPVEAPVQPPVEPPVQPPVE